ncbi:AP-4 complex subunit epsilon [Linum grandiflorum]
MGSAGICCTDGVLCTVLRACGKMEDGGRTARQVHAFAMKLQGGLNGKVVIQCGLIKMDKQKMVVTLNQIHLYWEIDPSELDFSNKLCHDWDGKPLAIMALPAILNNSNNLELMWKSESEVFHIIESAITVAALRWPEKLLAQKQRIFRPYNMACRYSSTNDDGGYNSTAYNQEITKEEEEEPVYNQEITKEEEKPRRRIIRIKLVKDGKPTTATTVGSGTGATTVGSGMGANLKMASDVPWSNSEEYEKKLENSKRKLKEGYSKFEDSRKRSKVCKYISVESKNHHLVSNKVTKKAAAVTRRRSENPKARITRYSEQFLRFRAVFYPPAVCLSDRFSGMRILQRWDDALRAYTVKASQASCSGSNIRIASHEQKDHYANLYAVVSGEKHFLLLPPTDVHRIAGLVCGFIMFVRVQTREAALLVGILPQVVELLGHQKEAVRKKAIMALHRFYQKSPSSVSHLVSNFRKLCKHTGVMSATLCPLFDLISRDVNSFKDLVVSFGYAMTALMKIYAFAMAAGRKVDVLPECETLIEELSASHSSDLQQRAYKLQAVLALDANAIKNIMPSDASCREIEVYCFPNLFHSLTSSDQTEIITNGNYRSAVHRAVTNSSMARLSVATFHDPAKTRNISPAPEIVSESSPQRYREVNYGDYMSRWYTKGPEGKRNIDSLLKLTLSSAVDCLE